MQERIQQALQWWSRRQSIKLFWEAEIIRDSLLQECFAIRRGLDLLAQDNLDSSSPQIQAYLQKIDDFHLALVKLSDRLCPIPIQQSLPLSIECLLETFLESSPHLYYQLDLPLYWQTEESTERSLLILRILEELFIIIIPEICLPVSVYIKLKNQKNRQSLVIKITYPDISTLMLYASLPELKYLRDSFQVLISGKCHYSRQSLSLSCIFSW